MTKACPEDGRLTILPYDALPPQAAAIRRAVFMEEQGFMAEFDETDAQAKHFVAYWEGAPAGTCRLYPLANGSFAVGRLAVYKAFRGKKIGSALLLEAERAARNGGGTRMELHAQRQAEAFYAALGYTPCGEPDEEEGCPHVRMEKPL